MDVSIIIPTKNGERYLNRVLNRIFSQVTEYRFEVIIIDSGSRDKTLEIIKKYPATLIEIKPEDFGHGKTRNYGAGLARGNFLVFLTQDAIPENREWLDKLINTYSLDNDIAGVYCRQVPRPFENPVSVEGIKNWIAGKDEFYVAEIESEKEFEMLNPLEKRLKVNFDNVASSIRKEIWESYPFPETQFAADHQWAKHILLSGLKIAFQPESAVIHSHDRSPVYEFKRRFIDHKVNYRAYKLILFPRKKDMYRGILGDIKYKTRVVLKSGLSPIIKLYYIIKNILVSIAQDTGTFLGADWEKKKQAEHSELYSYLERKIIKGV